MDCFDDCYKLQKLYLEGNQISKLEGLQNCQSLTELYIGNQKTRKPFTFDEYSLATISRTLRLLDMPNVNLIESKPLYYLESLQSLNLTDNRISDIQEHVAPLLMTMHYLTDL